MPSPELSARTIPGLHEFLMGVLPRPPRPSARAIDLGAGSGALAVRLQASGWDVCAADLDRESFAADVPFTQLDLNEPTLGLPEHAFDLVTAVEVIEHVEAPIAFLREVAYLLTPAGVAVITTPNVDSLPARLKFLLKGKVRQLDEWGDPTHISPIFLDLLHRQYLPAAGLRLVDHAYYPPEGFLTGRPSYRPVLRALRPILRPPLLGDIHVFTLALGEGSEVGSGRR